MVRACLFAWLTLAAAPVEACRLALVLALDVSSSVDADEDLLQRRGLAAALLHPEVQAAFFASPEPVALQVFEWSGRRDQKDLLNWRLIRTTDDLRQVADTLRNSTRGTNDMPTAMGYALGYAAIKLLKAPSCLFQTIDMAGDGVNNEGFGPDNAYAAFPFEGVTVNGLVIAAPQDTTEAFYRAEVIRGPAAFVEVAQGYDDYERAMQRKLVRELTAQMMGRAPSEEDTRG